MGTKKYDQIDVQKLSSSTGIQVTTQAYSNQQDTALPSVLQNIDWNSGNSADIDLQNSTAEVELVTEGNFATNTYWSFGSGWSFASTAASMNSTSTGTLYQIFGSLLDSDVVYKITFDITTAQAGQTVTPHLVNASGSIVVSGTAQSAASSGTFTQYLIATATCKGVGFVHAAVSGGVLDNVSVKAITTLKLVNPKKGATYIIKTTQPNIAELVANPTFPNPSPSWFFGSGWTLDTSNLRANMNSTSTGTLYQIFASLMSGVYKITFDVTVLQAGQTVTPVLTDASGTILVSGTAQSAASTGTFTQYLKATSLCKGIGFVHAAVSGGAIDNVSVTGLAKVIKFNPLTVMWPSGTEKSLSSTTRAIDMYVLYYDGTYYYMALNGDYKLG